MSKMPSEQKTVSSWAKSFWESTLSLRRMS